MKNELLRLNSITKSHQGRSILCDVSLCMYEKEIHAVITDNSIAKDMLINIINGTQMVDNGEIYIEEEELNPQGICESLKSRVSLVRSGEDVVTNLSMAENIFLLNGRCDERIWLSTRYMRLKVLKLFLRMGLNELNPEDDVETLTTLEKKLVMIARAVSSGAELIILDDVTAELEENEINRIYLLLRLLKEIGITFLYITSQLEEVCEIADRVSIIHNHSVVQTADVKLHSKQKIMAMLRGGRNKNLYNPSFDVKKREVLRVEKLFTKGVNGIDFSLFEGEITWISGLNGGGREELGRTLFGLSGRCRGRIYIDGKEVEIKSPVDAVSYRVAYISGKKIDQALIPDGNIKQNLSLGVINKISRFGKINLRLEKYIFEEWMRRLSLDSRYSDEQVMNLDNSDQYKIVVGRALAIKPKVLIISFPIRGIGFEVCIQLMNCIKTQCERGMSVLLLSSEVEGVIEHVDRVLVMEKGNIQKVICRNEIQNQLVKND